MNSARSRSQKGGILGKLVFFVDKLGVFGAFLGVAIGLGAPSVSCLACRRLQPQVPAEVPGLYACTRLRGAVSGCVATAGRGVRARRG